MFRFPPPDQQVRFSRALLKARLEFLQEALAQAVEIKGGADYSNVHNRIGEAEKSHRKARAEGYTECWTVVNVPGLDLKMAHKESPTTDRFYRLAALSDKDDAEYRDFRNRIASLTGIRLGNRKKS